jgi:hypothetical protein
MSTCQDCEPINGGGVITITEAQQPFCDQCGDDASCDEKMDSACVVYHLDFPEKANLIYHLGLGNGATAEQIFEALSGLIGNQLNIPLTVVDSSSIDLTSSGAANHTLKADVILSPDTGNILSIKSNGLFASASSDGRVKVNADDSLDYLINQVVGGTDGVVSISTVLTAGMVQFLPNIDIAALIEVISTTEEFHELVCQIVAECISRCPDINTINTVTTP